jgi:hypothetical protein
VKVVSTLAAGQVLSYRARSGRLHLMRVVGLLDTRDREAPIIRFLDCASRDLPDVGTLALIPDRGAHPLRWRYMEQAVIELRGVRPDDFGFTVVGTIERNDDDVRFPDVWSGWQAVAAYLGGRDRAMDSADY